MRRGRKPTPEERDLWQRAYGKPRHPIPPEAQPPQMPAPKPSLSGLRNTEREPLILRPVSRLEAGVTLPQPPLPKASGLDRATETRLRRGQRTPDAVLDLHGMTANRAHNALNRFISQSRTAGHRMVLIVTGKGAVGAPRDFGDPAPGVLRREVPVWLATPPLAPMIVNVTQAHPKHGGGGALYVYLKKIR